MKKSVFYLIMVFPWILQAQIPNLVSFTPQYGPAGSSVTLNGSDFDEVPTNNTVFFGGVQTMVLSASATELVVEVPKGTSYDFITVIIGDLVAQSNEPFYVTFDSEKSIRRSPDSFSDELTFVAGNEPYGLDAGDIDGDGLVDIVIGNYSGESFSVFKNISNGPGDINFDSRSDIALGAQANDLKINDFDGDGRLDMAAVTEDAMGTTYLEVARNITAATGSISFVQDVTITNDGYNYVIDAADFNSDGKIDIVVLDYDNAVVSVHENASSVGEINFEDDVDFAIGSNPYDVAIADVNADGMPDIVTLDGLSNTISILENTSSGGNIGFAAKVGFAVNPATSSNWLTLGDLNGDGLPDVVVQNGGSISVFKNESGTSISMALPQEISVAIENGPITIEDFNGDGQPDLLLNGQVNQVVLLENTSSGSTISFASPVRFNTSPSQYPLTFSSADLDNDGEPEIVGTTYHLFASNEYKLEVFRNFSAKSEISSFAFAEQVGKATIDISLNTIEIGVAGVPDLSSLEASFELSMGATAKVGADTQTSEVTLNDFSGPVTYTVIAEDGLTSQDWTITVALECELEETDLTEVVCESYDFDGQIIRTSGTYTRDYINRFGCDSIVTVDLTINPTEFFESIYAIGSYEFDGATLTTSGQYAYGPFTSSVTGCDSTFFLNLTIEPGTYDDQDFMQFQAMESIFPIIEEQGASHLEDVNGDGEKDLFIIGKSSTGVIASLFLNNGDGTFSEKTDHGIPGAKVGNRMTLFLDVNGDDVLDFLVFGKAGGSTFSKLYLNDGLGSFTEKSDHGLPDLGINTITSYLDSADIDSDDDLDLVISTYDAYEYDSYKSELWINNGDGSFALSTANDFPELGFSLADFADFDMDGDQDLLLRGIVEPYKIWLNDGTGVFTQKLDRSLATLSSKGMIIFDADGDGDLDIYDSNTRDYSNLYTAMYFNNGDGTFTYDLSSEMPRLDGYGGEAGTLSQAADFDNDGDLDLIMEGRYRFSGGPAEADYLEVWINNGFGHFRPLESRTLNEVFPSDTYQFGQELGYGNYQSNKLLNVYDFDRDGRLDIFLQGIEYISLFDRVGRIFSNRELSNELIVETCESYEFEGTTLTSSGSYQGMFADESGSSYPVNLDLTILESTAGERSVSVCESYEWEGTLFTVSGTNQEVLTNAVGCDSTATLNLTILEPISGEETVPACKSYEWEGTLYTVSGTYQELLTNSVGCDSTATLNLIILESTSGEETISACESYEWEGTLYTASGTYQEVLTNSVGCDSTATLNLTILESTSGEETISACESYEWEGTLYTASGTYQEVLTNSVGCDSTAFLNLTILGSDFSQSDVFACESYDWNGVTYTKSGTFDQQFTNVAGCDSTATLHLIIGSPSLSQTEVTTCDSYEWNGKAYTSSGLYTKLFTNAEGCDSAALLNLTIHESVIVEEDVVACEGHEFNGELISTSGEYQALFTSVTGCDSLVNLNLTINEPYFREEALNVCGSYLFGEQLITVSGLYLENFTASNGCDSLVSLTVDMMEEPDPGVELNGKVLFASDNSPDLSYQWYDCATDELLVGEDKRQLTPPRAGSYSVEVSNSVCQVTSVCFEITEELIVLGTENTAADLEIYPNPSEGPVNISWSQPRSFQLAVIGLDGKTELQEFYRYEQDITLYIDKPGLYLVRIQDPDSGQITEHKMHIR